MLNCYKMNKASTPKKSVLRSNNSNNDSPANKRQRQDKDENRCISFRKRYQERKNKPKVKRVARKGNLLNEWAENESSRGEINERTFRNRRTASKDSVIYVGTYQQHYNPRSLSIVDLTGSTESIPKRHNVVYSKSLKTIYFPSKNFDRNMNFRKTLTTTSVVALPVAVKPQLLIRQKSLSYLDKIKKDLSILEIPDKYLDGSEPSCTDFNTLFNQTSLNSSDYKIINWILEHEEHIKPVSSNSGCTSCLDIGIESIEELCRVYGVTSRDNFS